MSNDSHFKSCNLLINNDDSLAIKNDNELSSIYDEEQPLYDLKVKFQDEIFEKTHQAKCCPLIEISMPKQFSDEVKLFNHQAIGIKWLVEKESRSAYNLFFEQQLLSIRKICSKNNVSHVLKATHIN